MKDVELDNLQLLEQELVDLTNAFNEAMASGEIEEGSEAWYDMQISINDVKEEIDDATLSLIEYNNAIREIEWERFDYVRDRISKLTEEADFLIDLMSNSKLQTDNGQLTDEGTATIGLHAMNYNVYMAQADEYAKEMARINQQLAEDPYNNDLLERREELLELQQESILSAEEEKQAIVDLVEEGIDLELEALEELIDKYSEALDSAKDLYDYQNKVADQASEISNLRKQLLAYSGDTSEEGKANVQRIQDELSQAEKDLEETEYEQYISDQKKLLDELYIEYETILNQRLDNIDVLFEEMIETTNANSAAISDTLREAGNNVGYTLTDGMKTIWGESVTAIDGIVGKYGDDFGNKLTTVNETLKQIQTYTDKMNEKLDEEARIEAERKAAEEAAKKAAEEAAKKAQSSGGSSGKSSSGSSSGVGSSSSRAKKYASGGLADYTGLAILDGTPQKPELVLNQQDTKNFIQLKDTLRQLSSNGLDFANIQNYGAAFAPQFSGITDISGLVSAVGNYQNENPSNTFGDISITIPIERVEDYNDFVNQLRSDKKFEKMVQSMTIDRITGGSQLAKNKYKWS